MPTRPQENWTIVKPAVVSANGIVVAQNARAAAVGADILAAGGNAVDAAVGTALALGVVEPWMSGIGGVGFLVYGDAAADELHVVDFSAVAPLALDPGRYPLSAGTSGELFGWPRVEGDRNLRGYEAICVPGSVDGLGLAVERFGRLSWGEIIAPARDLAAEGLPVASMGAERSRSPWISSVGTSIRRISARKSSSTIARLQARATGREIC